MFNKERLRALAEQAKATGSRLATSAQAGLVQAQQQLAAVQQARSASAGDDAHVLGSPAPTPRPSLPGGLSAEEAAHLLSGQNAALRERLHGLIQDKGALQARVDLLEAIQKQRSEEHEQQVNALRSALEQAVQADDPPLARLRVNGSRAAPSPAPLLVPGDQAPPLTPEGEFVSARSTADHGWSARGSDAGATPLSGDPGAVQLLALELEAAQARIEALQREARARAEGRGSPRKSPERGAAPAELERAAAALATVEAERDGLREACAALEAQAQAERLQREENEGRQKEENERRQKEEAEGRQEEELALKGAGAETEKLMAAKEVLEVKVSTLRARVAELENEAEAAAGAAALSDRVAELEADLEREAQELTSVRAEMSEQQRQTEERHAESLASVRAEMSEQQRQMEEQHAESLASVRAEMSEQQRQMEEQHAETLTSTRAEFLEQQKQAEKRHAESLALAENDFRRQAEALALAQAELEARAAALDAALAGSRAEAEALEAAREAQSGQEARVAALEAEIEGRAEREAVLEASLAASGREAGELRAQVAELLAGRDSLEGARASELESASAELQAARTQLAELQGAAEDLAAATARIAELEAEAEELPASKARLAELEALTLEQSARVAALEADLNGASQQRVEEKAEGRSSPRETAPSPLEARLVAAELRLASAAAQFREAGEGSRSPPPAALASPDPMQAVMRRMEQSIERTHGGLASMEASLAEATQARAAAEQEAAELRDRLARLVAVGEPLSSPVPSSTLEAHGSIFALSRFDPPESEILSLTDSRLMLGRPDSLAGPLPLFSLPLSTSSAQLLPLPVEAGASPSPSRGSLPPLPLGLTPASLAQSSLPALSTPALPLTAASAPSRSLPAPARLEEEVARLKRHVSTLMTELGAALSATADAEVVADLQQALLAAQADLAAERERAEGLRARGAAAERARAKAEERLERLREEVSEERGNAPKDPLSAQPSWASPEQPAYDPGAHLRSPRGLSTPVFRVASQPGELGALAVARGGLADYQVPGAGNATLRATPFGAASPKSGLVRVFDGNAALLETQSPLEESAAGKRAAEALSGAPDPAKPLFVRTPSTSRGEGPGLPPRPTAEAEGPLFPAVSPVARVYALPEPAHAALASPTHATLAAGVAHAGDASEIQALGGAEAPGEARARQLERALADSERTHQLRDRATAVLKEEIAELRRSARRDGVDVGYLKNVVLQGFQSGELPSHTSMLLVLARLLEFSPAELAGIQARDKASASAAFALPFGLGRGG